MLNGIMLQFFHWYSWEGGNLWNFLKDEAPKLADLGVTAVWLPPASKGTQGVNSRGYDVYDLYDLGEFDQKGSAKTRYGSKDEYIQCIKTLQEHGITAIADIVLNHKGGGDEKEKVWVKKVNPENRNEFISDRFEIEAYTKFTFPGRGKKYSDFEWNSQCFSGVDYDAGNNESAIYSIQNEYGDGWEEVIDVEKGNFDYLMCCDIEYRNQAVRDEIKNWGKWFLDTTGFNGMRLDAIKHISPRFMNEFVDHMRGLKNDLFVVGEYWAPGDVPLLKKYIDVTQGRMSLFDASLHHNLYAASQAGKDYNMATIFDGSLVQEVPALAVTLVANHDTQPLQALEAPVNPWFKALAYALILLREKGYPCVFYPDLYGAKYTDKGKDGNDYEIYMPQCDHLHELLKARKEYAFGYQRDYIDHSNCIGWTREGKLDDDKTGCAVILSNGDNGTKWMEIGKRHAGKTFYDYLGHCTDDIQINQDGWAEFRCNGGSVSVWIQRL
jgi:alpha-amylase